MLTHSFSTKIFSYMLKFSLERKNNVVRYQKNVLQNKVDVSGMAFFFESF